MGGRRSNSTRWKSSGQSCFKCPSLLQTPQIWTGDWPRKQTNFWIAKRTNWCFLMISNEKLPCHQWKAACWRRNGSLQSLPVFLQSTPLWWTPLWVCLGRFGPPLDLLHQRAHHRSSHAQRERSHRPNYHSQIHLDLHHHSLLLPHLHPIEVHNFISTCYIS